MQVARLHSAVRALCIPNRQCPTSLKLEPPREKMLSTLGARSFYAAAPCLWNGLLAELRGIQSSCNFKRKLKTHLFRAG